MNTALLVLTSTNIYTVLNKILFVTILQLLQVSATGCHLQGDFFEQRNKTPHCNYNYNYNYAQLILF